MPTVSIEDRWLKEHDKRRCAVVVIVASLLIVGAVFLTVKLLVPLTRRLMELAFTVIVDPEPLQCENSAVPWDAIPFIGVNPSRVCPVPTR